MKIKRIEDPNSNSYAEVIPELGGILSKLVLKDTDLIVCPVYPDDYQKGFPSAFMFPFPSRIEHGKYEFEGKTYQFPINEPARGHAIHGFTSHVERSDASLSYHHKGDYEGYPFPFETSIEYNIINDCLSIIYKAKNTGLTNMPCALGWHPYFRINDLKIDEMQIKIPASKIVSLDEGMIARGESETIPTRTIFLKDTILDNGFHLDTVADFVQTELIAKDKKLVIWQETGNQKFNYLVIYTPPTRDCVAIEPLTSNINAFNNKEGLIVLKPNEEIVLRMKVWVE